MRDTTTVTKIYAYRAKRTFNSQTFQVESEEIEVKETPQKYRCVDKKDAPFNGCTMIDKERVGLVESRLGSTLTYFSKRKMELEEVKELFIAYLESKKREAIRRYETKISMIENVEQNLIGAFKIQYNLKERIK